VHVRYAGCVDYTRQLQFGAFCAEQSPPPTEQHRDQMDLQLIEQAR